VQAEVGLVPVERRHQGGVHLGVAEAQGVAELMSSHLVQIDASGTAWGGEREGWRESELKKRIKARLGTKERTQVVHRPGPPK